MRKLEKALDDLDRQLAKLENQSPSAVIGKTKPPASKIVAFDNRMAVERIVEIGANINEVDNFIGNQTQLMTMTEVEGFGIDDPNAVKILDISQ